MYSHLPPGAVSSAGREAAELSASAGLYLDDWQGWLLDGSLCEDARGHWLAFEVVIIVPRQNGKGGYIEARELAGLFLFGELLILHSAHEFKTSQEAFLRIKFLIDNCDDFRKRVKKISTSHGEEGITLRASPTIVQGSASGLVTLSREPRLRFVARTSAGSGRGFSGDTVFFDEAFNVPGSVVSALMPTMSARPNPQLIYLSSAVNQEEHPYGLTLAKARERGLAGDDPALFYAEWCADPAAYQANPTAVAMDPAHIAAANPALGIRLTLRHCLREARSMGPASRAYAVERLGLGDWPDTDPEAEQVFNLERWADLTDPASAIISDVLVMSLDMNPERTRGAISVAGGRADGLHHGEVIDATDDNNPTRRGVRWMLARAVELDATHGPLLWVIDPTSPAGSLIEALKEHGIEVAEEPGEPAKLELVVGREMAQACGYVYDLIDSKGLRHLGQVQIINAIAVARKRMVADAWALGRKDSAGDISPLVSLILALYGYHKHQNDALGPPNLWFGAESIPSQP